MLEGFIEDKDLENPANKTTFTLLHITRKRIRQIEAKALRRLRHPRKSRKLKEYLDY